MAKSDELKWALKQRIIAKNSYWIIKINWEYKICVLNKDSILVKKYIKRP